MKKGPLVSVIIPTRNNSSCLRQCLETIKQQNYKNIEIIVVDGGSTDNTKKIARRYTSRVYNYGKTGDYRSAQKNMGVSLAKGKYVLCADSDGEYSKNVINECVELGEKGYDMVIIPEKFFGQGFWAKAKALERQCYLRDNTIEAPWFFRRKVFISVGGYSEEMFAGEDWDLFTRLKNKGFRYARCKSFTRQNLGRVRFFKYVNKKRYYGSNIINFIKKSKGSFVKKIPFFRLAYIRNWKLLIKHPFLVLGFMILKFGEMLGMGIGMLEAKIRRNIKDYYAK